MGRGKKYYRGGKKRKYGGKSYEINTTAQRRLVLISVQHGKEGQAQRDLVCAYEETLDILYPNLPPIPAPKKLQKNVVPSGEKETKANDSSSGSLIIDSSKRSVSEIENNETESQGPAKKRVKLSTADDAPRGFAGMVDELEKERKAYETPHVQFIRGPMGMVILDFPSNDVDPVQMTIETLKRYVSQGIRPTRWAFKFFPLVSTCYVKMDRMKKLAVNVLSKHIAATATCQADSLPTASNRHEVNASTSSSLPKSKPTTSKWKENTPAVPTPVMKSVHLESDKQEEVNIVTTPPVSKHTSLSTEKPEDEKSVSKPGQRKLPTAESPITSEMPEVKQDSKQKQIDISEVKQDSKQKQNPESKLDGTNMKHEISTPEQCNLPTAESQIVAEMSKQQQSDISEVKQDSKQKQNSESKLDETVLKHKISTPESDAATQQSKATFSQTGGKQEKEVTYYIDYKKRSNSSVHREEILKMLMEVVPRHWRNRWKGKTDWVIVFQILGKLCGMSVVKGSDWHGLGSFSMTKLQKIRDDEQDVANPGSTDI